MTTTDTVPTTERPFVEVTLTIENIYPDGEAVTTHVATTVDAPASYDPDALDQWAEDVLFPHTGTGTDHGDAGYFVTITATDDTALLNRTFEWC